MNDLEKEKRTLPAKWAQYLFGRGETGMGYQIVDIILDDDTVVKDVAVIESNYIGQIRGYAGPMPPFDVNRIKDIRITHNKWNFRAE